MVKLFRKINKTSFGELVCLAIGDLRLEVFGDTSNLLLDGGMFTAFINIMVLH